MAQGKINSRTVRFSLFSRLSEKLDKIPSFLRSGIVYKFQYGGCDVTYYGKAKGHLKLRMCEHFGIYALIEKRVKGDDSAIK